MSKKISNKKLREFGFLIGFGFPLIIGWLVPSLTGHVFRSWTLWISIPTMLIGIVSPRRLQKPYQAWMNLGHLLGYVNSRLVLGIVYIFILQPISLIMKTFGYDPLRSKKAYLLSFKENKKGAKVDLKRIF